MYCFHINLTPLSMLKMTGEIITNNEVAQYLKVNERTVYRLPVAGKLPAFKVATAWRIRQHELESWIEKQQESHKGQGSQEGKGASNADN